MKQNHFIAVLYHIFYEDSYQLICEELKPVIVYNPLLLFNISVDTPDKITITKALKNCYPGCYIITTSNQGKDIGGKLALIELLLEIEINVDLLLLLHDKKSLQALTSKTWKQDLLRIIKSENVSTIISHFKDDSKCGIVATKEYIVHEPMFDKEFNGTNGKIIRKTIDQYQLKPPTFSFVGGTMFWVRAKPLLEFFKLHNPLEIRKQFEHGNVIDNFDGTITHTWERILSWIVTSDNYNIKGI